MKAEQRSIEGVDGILSSMREEGAGPHGESVPCSETFACIQRPPLSKRPATWSCPLNAGLLIAGEILDKIALDYVICLD